MEKLGDELQNPALFTDLYEMTMAQVYYEKGMSAPATFSLFIREYPPNRGYFVSAGLEDALSFLESLQYEEEDLAYLDSTGFFSEEFLHFLEGLRFTGDVYAVDEGRLFFQDEPVLEVTAPIIEGQVVESALINIVNFQSNLATKVSRCVSAADGRRVVDFSLRRTHGFDASLKAARAGTIAGMSATSSIAAGKRYGVPVAGTMAHSFVTSFEEEIDAFRAFAEVYGDRTVLLIDTYDTRQGAEKAATVAREMAERGVSLRGVRLDSGDMVVLSRDVRTILDDAGLDGVLVFASGGFDEYKIREYVSRGAPIDAFGVGTKMGVSADAPYTDMAYKLVHYDGRPVMKLSSGKKTLVAPKQVFRRYRNGRMAGDVIALREEALEEEALLRPAMENGRRTEEPVGLETARERFQEDFRRLHEPYARIEDPDTYPVTASGRLEALQDKVVQRIEDRELGES